MHKYIKIVEKRKDTFVISIFHHKAGSVEVIDRTEMAGDTPWQTISQYRADCDRGLVTAAIFDELFISCYQLSLPPIPKENIDSVVKLQAEALLPVSPERAVMAWYNPAIQNDKLSINLAAANRTQVEEFKRLMEPSLPDRVILAQEAMFKGVEKLRSIKDASPYAVVYVGNDKTELCVTDNRMLLDTAGIDFGWSLLSDGVNEFNPEMADQLTQIIKRTIENQTFSGDLKICLVSDGSEKFVELAGRLKSLSIEVELVIIDEKHLKNSHEVLSDSLIDLFTAFGAAELIYQQAAALDIFKLPQNQAIPIKKKHRIPSPLVSLIILAAVILIFTAACYFADVFRASKLEKYVETNLNGKNILTLRKEQKIREFVKQRRGGIIELMQSYNKANPGDITMDGLKCRLGKPAIFTGTTKKRDKLYDFEKKLRESKEFEMIREIDRKFDPKKREVNFSLSFEYGKFSK